jgi:hypothetical protein
VTRSLRVGELFRCGRSYTTLDAHLRFLLPTLRCPKEGLSSVYVSGFEVLAILWPVPAI